MLTEILQAPLKSPWVLTFSFAYFIVEAVRIYDARLIQAKSGGLQSGVAARAKGRQLPSSVGYVHFVGWILLLVLLILDWKFTIALYAFLFLLRVFPILEIIGELVARPIMSTASAVIKSLDYDYVRPFQMDLNRLPKSASERDIDGALKAYIHEYGLYLESREEVADTAEIHLKLEILKGVQKDAPAPLRPVIKKMLAGFSKIYTLMLERDENKARIEKSFDNQALDVEPGSPLALINREMEKIHHDMHSGVLSPEEALKKLDEIEKKLEDL